MSNIKNIFEVTNLLKSKYEHILYNSENEFNIFSILLDESDEVRLHSKFIYTLLSPNSKHYKGNLFTYLFLDQLGIELSKNKPIQVEREYKYIDILLTQSDIAIIIENKIWAGDQYKQIESYYKQIKKEGYKKIYIVYLTPYGDDPSEQSIGNLKNIDLSNMSYINDINNWLTRCLERVPLEPALRETISQYKKIVHKITGRSLSSEYIMEIKDLILKDNNIDLVNNIIEAFTEAKIEIQLRFWEALKSSLQTKGYRIEVDGNFTRGDVEKFYRNQRGGRYFGISFLVKEISTDTSIQYKIEIKNKIYHGFRAFRGSKGGMSKLKEYDSLAEIISKIDNKYKRTRHWLGWRFSDRDFNFTSFESEDIINLSNVETCRLYTDEIAVEIHNNITKFHRSIDS